MCLRSRRGDEKSLLKQRRKYKSYKNISLTALNGENLISLDFFFKRSTQGVYIGPRMILIQSKLQQSNQHRLREKKKPKSNPNWKQNRKKKRPDPDISRLGPSISRLA